MNPAELERFADCSDATIVQRVLSGETHLFEVIMRRHNQRVYRAVRAVLGDESETDDVMQEAYVASYAHLPGFEGRASFSTWLIRIAVHEAIARLHKRRRRESFQTTAAPEVPSMSPSHPRDPEQVTSDRELCALIERAMDRLPDDFRSVFMLRAVEGLSGAETAECLGITEETVKTRLHRARARLQESLLEAANPAVPKAFAFHLSRCDRVVAGVLARIRAGAHPSPAGANPLT